tara:strand:+ start:509 stop:1075 length:567 start_codon:yes stop_codon:yes gene_type:complete
MYNLNPAELTDNNYGTTILGNRKEGFTNKNKTIKKADKKNKMKEKMEELHDNIGNNEDEDEIMENFEPPVNDDRLRDSDDEDEDEITSKDPTIEGFNEIEGYENLDNLQNININDYYKKTVPMYNEASIQHIERDELLRKLNYMIHLLEEQKNERTGYVTEDLILYSFLGIFIIFVLDSFARVGKYVR